MSFDWYNPKADLDAVFGRLPFSVEGNKYTIWQFAAYDHPSGCGNCQDSTTWPSFAIEFYWRPKTSEGLWHKAYTKLCGNCLKQLSSEPEPFLLHIHWLNTKDQSDDESSVWD